MGSAVLVGMLGFRAARASSESVGYMVAQQMMESVVALVN